MDESSVYQIKVRNGLDEASFNAASPLQVSIARIEPGDTVLTTRADQSALVGLLRYLHQQGYLLLSIIREP